MCNYLRTFRTVATPFTGDDSLIITCVCLWGLLLLFCLFHVRAIAVEITVASSERITVSHFWAKGHGCRATSGDGGHLCSHLSFLHTQPLGAQAWKLFARWSQICTARWQSTTQVVLFMLILRLNLEGFPANWLKALACTVKEQHLADDGVNNTSNERRIKTGIRRFWHLWPQYIRHFDSWSQFRFYTWNLLLPARAVDTALTPFFTHTRSRFICFHPSCDLCPCLLAPVCLVWSKSCFWTPSVSSGLWGRRQWQYKTFSLRHFSAFCQHPTGACVVFMGV